MDECAHGLEFGCTFCSGKATTDARVLHPARPAPGLWIEPIGRVDPEMVIAEKVAAGEICSLCLTPHAPMGCVCSRADAYHLRNREASTWAQEQVEDGTLGHRGPQIAAGLAYTANRRARLRANSIAQATVDADRREIAKLTGLVPQHDDESNRWVNQPQWRPFRRQEADHLPV